MLYGNHIKRQEAIISSEENLEEIIRCSQQNDLQAQEVLVRQFQGRVAGFVLSMVGHQENVEDLTQIIFIKMLKTLPSLKKIERFQSWLFRIARNTCVDHLRLKKWKQLFVHFGESHENIPAESRPSFSEDVEWLLKELQELPPPQREVMALVQDDSLSYQEMADTLKCSIESIKSRIFRARTTLQERKKRYEKSRLY